MPQMLDGARLAQKMKQALREEIEKRRSKGKRPPSLRTVLVGENAASEIYVRNKIAFANEVGMKSSCFHLLSSCPQNQLFDLIGDLNADPEVDGILVQLPLPKQIDVQKVMSAILPDKDVDGFHPYNIGRLILGEPIFQPCTPAGIMQLLDDGGIDLRGQYTVVIGCSNIVGKPLTHMLLARDATVTVCNIHTRDLEKITKRADIVVSAVGKPRLLGRDHIREGAVIVDVGINRQKDGTVVGDVDADAVMDIVKAITPVPGGVGPMTVAVLAQNTLLANQLHLDG